MKRAVLTLGLLISGWANAQTTTVATDLNFSVLGSYGTHNITTSGEDSLIISTGTSVDGFGSGISLLSGNSVQISSSGTGGMILSTNNADVDVNSGGEVVLNPTAGHYVDLYGDGVYVASSYGLQLAPSAPAPACNSSFQGTLYYQAGGSGAADQLQICMKAADDSYSWKNVSF